MYVKIEPFGIMAFGEIIGSAWLSLVEIVLKYGKITNDEERKRLSLQNIRMKSLTQNYPDPLLIKYGNRKNIEEIINLTFNKEIMHDFDVVPSFSPGSQSYYARIKNWKMLDFVIKRLTEIPESKKAVMSFIREEDYERVLEKPKDDYLPCITTIQFRLIPIEKEGGYQLNTLFSARSIDAYQKAGGNLAAIVLLSQEVAKRIEKNLIVPIKIGTLDGMITDAHIYQETIQEAKETIKNYKNYEHNN
jgi:thymidylate synthase